MTDDANSKRNLQDFLASENIARALLLPDDGQAAKSHVDAGRPIYYCENAYPDELVRKWPDGKRDLVKVAHDGTVTNVRLYPSKFVM